MTCCHRRSPAPDLHLYPVSGPDLTRAKQLAGHIRATAVMYTPNVSPWLKEAQIIRTDLRPLGIDVQIDQFPISDFFDRIGRRGAPFDLAVSGWAYSGTDPAPVLDLFDGTTITATSNNDISYFDNAAFSRELHAAAELSGPDRYRRYAQLERELDATTLQLRRSPSTPAATSFPPVSAASSTNPSTASTLGHCAYESDNAMREYFRWQVRPMLQLGPARSHVRSDGHALATPHDPVEADPRRRSADAVT